MEVSIDISSRAVRLGDRAARFRLDARLPGARVEIEGEEYAVRTLRWREKRWLARFAPLGPQWIEEQFVAACLAEGEPPADPDSRRMLAALAQWLNDPEGSQDPLPLKPEALAQVTLDLCRMTGLSPEAFDEQAASEVEAMWSAGARAWQSTAQEDSGSVRRGSSQTQHATRIDVVPDPEDAAAAEGQEQAAAKAQEFPQAHKAHPASAEPSPQQDPLSKSRIAEPPRAKASGATLCGSPTKKSAAGDSGTLRPQAPGAVPASGEQDEQEAASEAGTPAISGDRPVTKDAGSSGECGVRPNAPVLEPTESVPGDEITAKKPSRFCVRTEAADAGGQLARAVSPAASEPEASGSPIGEGAKPALTQPEEFSAQSAGDQPAGGKTPLLVASARARQAAEHDAAGSRKGKETSSGGRRVKLPSPRKPAPARSGHVATSAAQPRSQEGFAEAPELSSFLVEDHLARIQSRGEPKEHRGADSDFDGPGRTCGSGEEFARGLAEAAEDLGLTLES